MIDLNLLQHAVMDSRDGIVIADARAADMPLIFINPAFSSITGYDEHECLGRNCRFLQGGSINDGQRTFIRNALATGQGFSEVLANYRKDGTLFWNELSVSPIHDQHGVATHYIGFQKDVTQRVLLDERLRARNRDLESAKRALEELVTTDALTGVYNRRHFDGRIQTLWQIAMRTPEPMAVFFIDIDNFKGYNDRFGHQAGDTALVKVARTLAARFQRASDFVARYGGEEFVVVACGMGLEAAANFADDLCRRIRGLELAHPDSAGGQVTISVGYTVVEPQRGLTPEVAIEHADRALFVAKREGGDRARSAPAPKPSKEMAERRQIARTRA